MTRRNGKAPKSIAAEIAELRALAVPELVARYEEVFGQRPRSKHRVWLWRRIAWKIQEQRLGGLSTVAKRRLDELIAEIDLPLAGRTVKATVPRPATGEPPVGTTLVRPWRDTEIVTTRTDEGWEHGGVVYGSLSAVAKAATGAHRSGLAFFGLAQGKERSA